MLMGKNRESGPSATWSYEIIMMFCDLCLREIACGNRPNTHFNKAGWSNLVESFKAYSGRDYDRLQLKNKWDQLKKEWKLWKDLKKGASGFSWNAKRRTIDGSDEWWEHKIEELPSIKKFKYNGIEPELEEKLDKMFMSVMPIGENELAADSESLPPNVTDEDQISEDCDSAKSLFGDTEMLNETPRLHSGSKRASRPLFHCKGYKNRTENSKTRALHAQIQQFVDAATLRSKVTEAALSKSFSITEAVGALDSIEELEEDSEVYGFAIDLIMQKDNREMFMALKPHKRTWYLSREFEKSKKIIS